MSLTPDQKVAAHAALKAKLEEMRASTISQWLQLFEDPSYRPVCGYSLGADNMVSKLAKAYRKKADLMRPFDRGDYD